MKTRIYATPAVKGLSTDKHDDETRPAEKTFTSVILTKITRSLLVRPLLSTKLMSNTK